MAAKSSLIWIDLEMTGLNPEYNHIIEIATLVTDANLNVLAEGPVMAIHQPAEILAAMDEWNTKQHGGSGLVQRVQASTISVQQAEQATLAFLKHYVQAGQSPMCGNTVHQDRRFLMAYMPELANFFHYRHLDVSTLKVLNEYWDLVPKFEKPDAHLALQDIYASIDELKYYRQHFIRHA